MTTTETFDTSKRTPDGFVHLVPVYDEDDELLIVRFEPLPITKVINVSHTVEATGKKVMALTLRSALGALRENSIVRLAEDGPILWGKKSFATEEEAIRYFNRRTAGNPDPQEF